MWIHRTASRVAALTGLCLALALATAATVAAYPVMPEGEPVHLEGAQPTSPTPVGASLPRSAGATRSSRTDEPASPTVFASSGADWSGAVAVASAAGLAALACLAAGLVLANYRRRSAETH